VPVRSAFLTDGQTVITVAAYARLVGFVAVGIVIVQMLFTFDHEHGGSGHVAVSAFCCLKVQLYTRSLRATRSVPPPCPARPAAPSRNHRGLRESRCP
jgi:hypothetical protein